MGWLDTQPDCIVCPTSGQKQIGLQLLLEIDNHLKLQWWDNTVGKQQDWKRIQAVRVPLHGTGVKFLDEWFKDKTLRLSKRISENLVCANLKYIKSHAIIGRGMRTIHPQLDFIDLTYIQYGLDGCLWEEFPNGIPGILVEMSNPYEAFAGWVPVTVTQSFPSPPEIEPFLPCKGVLAWDFSPAN